MDIVSFICIIMSKLSCHLRFRWSTAGVPTGGLIELLAQILPIMDHDLLDSQQGLITDVRVFVGQMVHYHLLPAQFVHNIFTAWVMPKGKMIL